MRTEKAHNDQPVYYNKTGDGRRRTIEELYDDVEEGTKQH